VRIILMTESQKKYLIIIFLLLIGLGMYLVCEKTIKKNDQLNDFNKINYNSRMSKSANYSIALLSNLDDYLMKNNYVSYNNYKPTVRMMSNENNIIEIDAKDIIDSEEFATCNGKIFIEKGNNSESNYTIKSRCSDDSEEGQNLIIKRYDGINNLGLNALHKLLSIDDGYIGLFDYSENSEKCKDNEYVCQRDGFAVASLSQEGDINNGTLLLLYFN